MSHPFFYCWTRFWRTLWTSNYVYHMSFRILGSQESSASNGARFGFETKKLWPFEDKCAKLSGNFAAETPFGRVFRSCETTLWHTSATSQRRTSISQLRNGLRKSPSSTKSSPRCGNHLIRSQLVSQLIHVLSMVPDSGAI